MINDSVSNKAKEQNYKMEKTRKQSTQNFPKNEHVRIRG